MRACPFRRNDQERVGALVADDGQIVDLQQAFTARGGNPSAALVSMQALIAAGEPGLTQARFAEEAAQRDGTDLVPVRSARLLAPVPVPAQMRDFFFVSRST